MNTEEKVCQNCKGQFLVEPVDFAFYERMQVPPPTFCPTCRFERRLMFKNARVFYRRQCGLCGESMLSMYSPTKDMVVYCQPCWWSDKWDSADYAMDYDPNRNFFEQFKELQRKVPFAALSNGYATLTNSDYVNEAAYAKNCYLIFNADYNENVLYGSEVTHNKDAADVSMLEGSELCYEDINCEKCFKTFFSEDCISSTNIYFSKNLSGCSDCFGCVNLRSKKYHIWNQPYTKEEYEKKLSEIRLDSFEAIEALREEAYEFWGRYPHKMIQGIHNVSVSGDYIYESKGAQDVYQVRNSENIRYSQYLTMPSSKDVYDLTQWGGGAQRVYDTVSAGEGVDMIRFCVGTWGQASGNEYSMYVVSSSYMFGSICMRKKKFCILNKQYTEAEYKELRAKIIADLEVNPYVDAKGRIFKYGEFFPYDLSLFDYNESGAMQIFPLKREEVNARGWRWHEANPSNHQVTLPLGSMPDSIKDVDETVLKEILGCKECKKAYRVIPAELELLKRFGLPLPRRCADCRNMARISRTNPPHLWDRDCANCRKEIRTSYSPDRPETVYCEQCYQAEVA
jgi:hypothetical protein